MENKADFVDDHRVLEEFLQHVFVLHLHVDRLLEN